MSHAGARGDFLSSDELSSIAERNTVLDLHSVLVSRFATLGEGNTLYPGVVIQADDRSELTIGSDNVFYPGAFLLAESGGRLRIGSSGDYGPGGVQVKANAGSSEIRIGDGVRIANGPEIVGLTSIGDGGQVIGPIRAQSVQLAGGGDHQEPDPDRRAGVLKGVGLARGLVVGVGEVVNGLGDFAVAPIERQRFYHPGA
ncbi:hypothetical protein [Leifsonia sp. 71-9]|uniref:hypothetical protein n=1 Tax=Leifsonia sp. 71-9 TaxID=1895934 RepID=UPI00092ACE5B|nr:hypothetical protein [Leifsonia sp. 71-9]OJX72200.1 MAG: hypothetical protein BGO91_10995 [Leifsonia sp. 71-9]